MTVDDASSVGDDLRRHHHKPMSGSQALGDYETSSLGTWLARNVISTGWTLDCPVKRSRGQTPLLLTKIPLSTTR